MRSFTIAAAFAALAMANPVPQDLSWADIDAADPIPSVTIPVVNVVALASTVEYVPSAAAETVAAQVSAAGGVSDVEKRDIQKRSCAPQPTGISHKSSPDTASGFANDPYYCSMASAAPTPAGYAQTFTNLNASNNAYGYMGYTVLSSYDTNACAAKCNAIDGCAAINIYFERDPSMNPDSASCSNPSSFTNVKCVFWGGPVNSANANNYGQYRNDFQVVIAGSNGYVNASIATPPGYTPPGYLGTAAINAPDDCNGRNTYIGVQIFTDGPFDSCKCAAACTAQLEYAYEHPPSDGSKPMTCQFFNTYMLLRNNTPVGQYCSLYNETWASSYATNVGQYRQNDYGYTDHYTIDWSYTFSNATDACPASQCKQGVW